ncbi:MAG: DUF4149 domain-containing protein [Pseudacidovorax sp.]|uniref:DUF4149 domain-containing protein n=1 Tax=Pseudacidovorax sp. TaxID=1934311 RepID=UPI001B476E1A|nr:DUF4149 domain-containing protein [Pseudacidovorax sp.]MBP6897010.1 DUF4149 domain-containing protein [Pseudacidovorax sp.]
MAWKPRVALMAAGLWWGSLTAIGFVVVPLLFMHLPTPALAGATAAKLFSAQTWITVGCVLLMLVAMGRRDEGEPETPPGVVMLMLGGLLLALLVEYAVAPRIVARENLRLWHGVGTAMYAAQWLCAGATLWRRA